MWCCGCRRSAAFCPPMMTKSLIKMLIELGVEEGGIYMDDFGG